MASGIAGHPVRSIADQTGAQERRRLGIAIGVGQLEGIAGVRHRVLRVPAVELIPGEARFAAQVLPALPAEAALVAGVAEPRHADAIADGETRDAVADLLDHADDLVAGHDRQLRIRQLAGGDVQIGPADAARAHLDERARPAARSASRGRPERGSVPGRVSTIAFIAGRNTRSCPTRSTMTRLRTYR